MKKALVAGAFGVSGRALVNHLVALGDWEVVGLSRRRPEFETPARYVAIDLLNPSDVDACMSQLGEVTHIFYAALQMVGNFFEEIAPNLAMLRNTVEAVERSSAGLRKVVLLEGAKYYGAHRVRTKPRRRRATRGICRRIFTMTRRITWWRAAQESPGPGRRCVPPAFAASLWVIP